MLLGSLSPVLRTRASSSDVLRDSRTPSTDELPSVKFPARESANSAANNHGFRNQNELSAGFP